MSTASKKTAVWIQIGIMIASIAVFLGAVSLVGGGFSERGSRFWVTVVSIIFAQVVWFNVPIWMAASDARNKASFPFQFTAMSFCTMYAVGVFAMALLVAFTSLPSAWVWVGHMPCCSSSRPASGSTPWPIVPSSDGRIRPAGQRARPARPTRQGCGRPNGGV